MYLFTFLLSYFYYFLFSFPFRGNTTRVKGRYVRDWEMSGVGRTWCEIPKGSIKKCLKTDLKNLQKQLVGVLKSPYLGCLCLGALWYPCTGITIWPQYAHSNNNSNNKTLLWIGRKMGGNWRNWREQMWVDMINRHCINVWDVQRINVQRITFWFIQYFEAPHFIKHCFFLFFFIYI